MTRLRHCQSAFPDQVLITRKVKNCSNIHHTKDIPATTTAPDAPRPAQCADQCSPSPNAMRAIGFGFPFKIDNSTHLSLTSNLPFDVAPLDSASPPHYSSNDAPSTLHPWHPRAREPKHGGVDEINSEKKHRNNIDDSHLPSLPCAPYSEGLAPQQ